MDKVTRLDVIVTGGFHSQTVTDILQNEGVSYIVITPNVQGGVKEAEKTYYEIAKEQKEINFQTLAAALLSNYPPKLVIKALLESGFTKKELEFIYPKNLIEEAVNQELLNPDQKLVVDYKKQLENVQIAKLLESDDVDIQVLKNIVVNIFKTNKIIYKDVDIDAVVKGVIDIITKKEQGKNFLRFFSIFKKDNEINQIKEIADIITRCYESGFALDDVNKFFEDANAAGSKVEFDNSKDINDFYYTDKDGKRIYLTCYINYIGVPRRWNESFSYLGEITGISSLAGGFQFIQPVKVTYYKYEYEIDEKGMPIPKLDDDGNPIPELDADGNKVKGQKVLKFIAIGYEDNKRDPITFKMMEKAAEKGFAVGMDKTNNGELFVQHNDNYYVIVNDFMADADFSDDYDSYFEENFDGTTKDYRYTLLEEIFKFQQALSDEFSNIIDESKKNSPFSNEKFKRIWHPYDDISYIDTHREELQKDGENFLKFLKNKNEIIDKLKKAEIKDENKQNELVGMVLFLNSDKDGENILESYSSEEIKKYAELIEISVENNRKINEENCLVMIGHNDANIGNYDKQTGKFIDLEHIGPTYRTKDIINMCADTRDPRNYSVQNIKEVIQIAQKSLRELGEKELTEDEIAQIIEGIRYYLLSRIKYISPEAREQFLKDIESLSKLNIEIKVSKNFENENSQSDVEANTNDEFNFFDNIKQMRNPLISSLRESLVLIFVTIVDTVQKVYTGNLNNDEFVGKAGEWLLNSNQQYRNISEKQDITERNVNLNIEEIISKYMKVNKNDKALDKLQNIATAGQDKYKSILQNYSYDSIQELRKEIEEKDYKQPKEYEGYSYDLQDISNYLLNKLLKEKMEQDLNKVESDTVKYTIGVVIGLILSVVSLFLSTGDASVLLPEQNAINFTSFLLALFGSNVVSNLNQKRSSQTTDTNTEYINQKADIKVSETANADSEYSFLSNIKQMIKPLIRSLEESLVFVPVTIADTAQKVYTGNLNNDEFVGKAGQWFLKNFNQQYKYTIKQQKIDTEVKDNIIAIIKEYSELESIIFLSELCNKKVKDITDSDKEKLKKMKETKWESYTSDGYSFNHLEVIANVIFEVISENDKERTIGDLVIEKIIKEKYPRFMEKYENINDIFKDYGYPVENVNLLQEIEENRKITESIEKDLREAEEDLEKAKKELEKVQSEEKFEEVKKLGKKVKKLKNDLKKEGLSTYKDEQLQAYGERLKSEIDDEEVFENYPKLKESAEYLLKVIIREQNRRKQKEIEKGLNKVEGNTIKYTIGAAAGLILTGLSVFFSSGNLSVLLTENNLITITVALFVSNIMNNLRWKLQYLNSQLTDTEGNEQEIDIDNSDKYQVTDDEAASIYTEYSLFGSIKQIIIPFFLSLTQSGFFVSAAIVDTAQKIYTGNLNNDEYVGTLGQIFLNSMPPYRNAIEHQKNIDEQTDDMNKRIKEYKSAKFLQKLFYIENDENRTKTVGEITDYDKEEWEKLKTEEKTKDFLFYDKEYSEDILYALDYVFNNEGTIASNKSIVELVCEKMEENRKNIKDKENDKNGVRYTQFFKSIDSFFKDGKIYAQEGIKSFIKTKMDSDVQINKDEGLKLLEELEEKVLSYENEEELQIYRDKLEYGIKEELFEDEEEERAVNLIVSIIEEQREKGKQLQKEMEQDLNKVENRTIVYSTMLTVGLLRTGIAMFLISGDASVLLTGVSLAKIVVALIGSNIVNDLKWKRKFSNSQLLGIKSTKKETDIKKTISVNQNLKLSKPLPLSILSPYINKVYNKTKDKQGFVWSMLNKVLSNYDVLIAPIWEEYLFRGIPILVGTIAGPVIGPVAFLVMQILFVWLHSNKTKQKWGVRIAGAVVLSIPYILATLFFSACPLALPLAYIVSTVAHSLWNYYASKKDSRLNKLWNKYVSKEQVPLLSIEDKQAQNKLETETLQYEKEEDNNENVLIYDVINDFKSQNLNRNFQELQTDKDNKIKKMEKMFQNDALKEKVLPVLQGYDKEKRKQIIYTIFLDLELFYDLDYIEIPEYKNINIEFNGNGNLKRETKNNLRLMQKTFVDKINSKYKEFFNVLKNDEKLKDENLKNEIIFNIFKKVFSGKNSDSKELFFKYFVVENLSEAENKFLEKLLNSKGEEKKKLHGKIRTEIQGKGKEKEKEIKQYMPFIAINDFISLQKDSSIGIKYDEKNRDFYLYGNNNVRIYLEDFIHIYDGHSVYMNGNEIKDEEKGSSDPSKYSNIEIAFSKSMDIDKIKILLQTNVKEDANYIEDGEYYKLKNDDKFEEGFYMRIHLGKKGNFQSIQTAFLVEEKIEQKIKEEDIKNNEKVEQPQNISEVSINSLKNVLNPMELVNKISEYVAKKTIIKQIANKEIAFIKKENENNIAEKSDKVRYYSIGENARNLVHTKVGVIYVKDGKVVDENEEGAETVQVRLAVNKNNEYIFYSNTMNIKNIDNIDTVIEELMDKFRNEGVKTNLFNDNTIFAFPNTDKKVLTETDIENSINNKQTSYVMPAETIKYTFEDDEDINERICKGIKDKTGITTFVVSKQQYEKVKQLDTKGYSFIVKETDIDTAFKNIEENQGDVFVDLSSQEYNKETAEEKLKQIRNNKLATKQGVNLAVTVKFSNDTYEKLKDINIFEKYGIIPIVEAKNKDIVKGKKEIDNITDIKELEDKADIIGYIFNGKNIEVIEKTAEEVGGIKTIIENIRISIKDNPQKQYNKGHAAALKNNGYQLDDSKDITSNVIDLKELLQMNSKDIEELLKWQGEESIIKIIKENLSLFNPQAQSYINEELLAKGKYIEAIGFILGVVENSVAEEVVKEFELGDGEKFIKEIGSNENQAILMAIIGQMIKGKNLEQIKQKENDYEEEVEMKYPNGVINLKDLVKIIKEEQNMNLDKILRTGIDSETAEDVKGIKAILTDRYGADTTVEKAEVAATLAIRSMLAAA
ncbi:hypothetical protein [Candidatus Ruminimicrobium bovinum]|uniref:hypothetical protein n=1 Tax=Candidatus Ruminimicrobium bovinum TaxID=3242779 RepID=UPI0039B93DD1